MIKLLIVDDESMARKHIRYNFPWQEWGIEIIGEAANGVEALEFCQSMLPDLMLIDITMPIMGGLELLELIKQRWPNIQCILLTAHRNFEFAQKAVQLGSSGYLLKSPIDIQETKATVERARQSFIQLSASEVTEKQQQYLLSNYRYSLRKNFFENILNGLVHDQDVVKEAASLGLNIHNRSYFMILCTVDQQQFFVNKYPSKDHNLVEFSFMEIIRETLVEYMNQSVEILPSTFGKCILLLQLNSENEWHHTTDSLHSLLRNLLNTLNQSLRKLMSISLSMITSEKPIMASRLRTKFNQITPYCNHLYYMKESSLIVIEKTPSFQNLTENQFVPFTDEFKSVYHSKSPLLLENWLDRVQQFSLTYKPDPEKMKVWFDSLKQCVDIAASTNRPEIEDWPSFLRSSSLYDTLLQLNQWVLNSWHLHDNQIKVRPEIAETITFIKDNLKDDLSLNHIADHIQLSPTYLGRIFKKEMGVSIIDYIMEQRIYAAKRLMNDTSYRSYEISDKVGFNSYSYFCTMFKKIVKQSPNEYRNSNKSSIIQ